MNVMWKHKDKLTVSFVIPVLNGQQDIRRCLGSIKQLYFPPEAWEVIVMDNGSTDGTTHIVREMGFEFFVVPNVHVSTLRNQGVAKAKGEFIAFVDADVELTPNWLKDGLIVFKDVQVVASGCFPAVPLKSTWVQQAWDIHQRGTQHSLEPAPIAWLPSMNLIVRRADFLAVCGFNERLVTVEDVDLCYRLGQRGKILLNRKMHAIHWGEARDLGTFWRKESWRSTSNLLGVLSHGLRWDELPSLGYPVYVVVAVVFVLVSIVVDIAQGQFSLIPLSVATLIFPAVVLALTTALSSKRFAWVLRLFLLYLVYGLARAYALVRS